MGEKTRETLKLQFDKRLRLEFHGAGIISDAGLLACRELDGVPGLAEMAILFPLSISSLSLLNATAPT